MIVTHKECYSVGCSHLFCNQQTSFYEDFWNLVDNATADGWEFFKSEYANSHPIDNPNGFENVMWHYQALCPRCVTERNNNNE